MTGIDQLAAAIAYWVSHPWVLIFTYLTFVALKVITEGVWKSFMAAVTKKAVPAPVPTVVVKDKRHH